MTRDVVPYNAPVARQTRSQVASTLDTVPKSLMSRLEMIPLSDVESILARQTRKHQPECSLLSYLREPGHGMTTALAAASLLEELADGMEDVSTSTALVVRYVQAHRLWEDHPNPAIDSLEALLGTVDGIQYVQAAAVVGTTSQFNRAKIAVLIEQHWGPTWFQEIPAEMKNPDWTRASDCSHQLLGLMAANATQMSLRDACRGWAESMRRRRDETIRRETGMRFPRSPFIIPEDVRSLNPTMEPAKQGRRTAEVYYPDKLAEDQLRVESVPSARRREYSQFGASRGTKRKRKQRDQQREAQDKNAEPTTTAATDEVDDANDGWRLSKDGKWWLKRVGRQIIRKPLEIESMASSGNVDRTSRAGSVGSHVASSRDSTPESGQAAPVPLGRSSPKQAGGAEKPPKCEGPRIAALLRYLVDDLSTQTAETPAMVNMAERCCDSCGPDVDALSGLVDDFTRIARSLESVLAHRRAGFDVGCLSAPGTAPSTPHLPRRRRTWLPIADDLDDG